MKRILVLLIGVAVLPTIAAAAQNGCPVAKPYKYIVSFTAYGPPATPSKDAVSEMCVGQLMKGGGDWGQLETQLQTELKASHVVVTNVIPDFTRE